MTRHDMAAVLAIEHSSFEFPWTEEEFLGALKKRNVIGMVAEVGHFPSKVVGFMVYELLKGQLKLHDLAVHPARRREGAGRQLVAKLIGKLSDNPNGRARITIMVAEDNIDSCLFLRRQGFLATEVVPSPYDTSPYDGYLMEYDLDAAPGVGIGARVTVV